MFERLTNEDISNALNELIACLGVGEEIPFHGLVALLRKKDTEKCVQEIASRLGLPVRTTVSYVPKDFAPDNADGFHSSALGERDRTGHGSEGITAQVSIPRDLPMFGASSLQGYPIQVRVSENCLENPSTFVVVIAHELSHVLLASLRSPYKDSELHTDLVPIVLGFRDVVRGGRKIIESTMSQGTRATCTTAYGYLTDAQFEFACDYVAGVLQNHSLDKKRLLEMVKQTQRKTKRATRSLMNFRDYFSYLDSNPPSRMRKQHADRVVQLHGQDYAREWESRIATVREKVEIAEAFVRPLNHYSTSSVEYLKTHIRILELAATELAQITETITENVGILREYVGFFHRLRSILLWYSY